LDNVRIFWSFSDHIVSLNIDKQTTEKHTSCNSLIFPSFICSCSSICSSIQFTSSTQFTSAAVTKN